MNRIELVIESKACEWESNREICVKTQPYSAPNWHTQNQRIIENCCFLPWWSIQFKLRENHWIQAFTCLFFSYWSVCVRSIPPLSIRLKFNSDQAQSEQLLTWPLFSLSNESFFFFNKWFIINSLFWCI